uniref:NADH dehydrogenase subunit 6 n=1 Tax=Panagrolaimus davidi TaxID=227884 RepID=A0A914Q4G2_9BILA
MYCRIIGSYCSRALLMSIYTTDFEIYFAYISDISYAILATILCFTATLNIAIKKRSKNQKVETVLLIQSFTSSVFLILSTATSWLANANQASNDFSTPPTDAEISETFRSISLQTFFNAFSKFFYDVHHYIGLLLLLIMSKNFRTKYLEFYKITSLFKQCKKAIKTETGATITVIPPASTNTTPRMAHRTSTFLH